MARRLASELDKVGLDECSDRHHDCPIYLMLNVNVTVSTKGVGAPFSTRGL